MPSRTPDASPPLLPDPTRPLPTGALSRRRNHGFVLRPEGAALADLAGELGALSLRKVRLEGVLIPEGQEDWRLEATLGATAVQPCVVTASPVTTRIDQPVLRRFLADMPAPAPGEIESPEDDSIEPLGASIDLMAVLHESLALALPDYPRASSAPADAAEDLEVEGATPAPARPNPFAVLATLRQIMPDADAGDTSRDRAGHDKDGKAGETSATARRPGKDDAAW